MEYDIVIQGQVDFERQKKTKIHIRGKIQANSERKLPDDYDTEKNNSRRHNILKGNNFDRNKNNI